MRIILSLVVLTVLGSSAAAQPASQAPKKMEQLIAEAQRRMNDAFKTEDFQHKMPFAKFLRMLVKEISKEKKFSIEFDREAFGNNADKMLKAGVSLPPVPARLAFFTALRLALAQANVGEQEIEFTARPGTLVITSRDRSLFTATYEIGELLKHTRYLHQGQRFVPDFSIFDLKADPAKKVRCTLQ